MSGRVLRSGRLRVDAQRAASKIRAHLFADPSTWLCEIVRAAALSKATLVEIDHDSDDVWITFDGAPWTIDFLERAAGDLGIEAGAAEGPLAKRGRVATLALFGALGDEIETVEVFVPGEAAALVGARLERAGLEDPSLPRAAARPRPKDDKPVRALCIHAERPLSLRTAGRFFLGGRPPEVSRLVERWSRHAPPVSVRGRPLVEPPRQALPTLELSEPPRLSIQLHPGAPHATCEAFEHGVLLVSETLLVPGTERALTLPIAVRAFDDVIPTNVSRARAHADWVTRVSARVLEALPRLLDMTLAEARAAEWNRARGLLDALGEVAWAVATNPTLLAQAPHAVHLPLLETAWGEPRSLDQLFALHRDGVRALVAAPDEPVGEDVRALVPDVFRRRELAIEERAFATNAAPLASAARELEAGLARRARALATPPTAWTLPVEPGHIHRAERMFEGQRVEIAIRAHDPLAPHSSVRLLVDGHVLETAKLATAPGRVAFDVLCALPPDLRPNSTYTGILRTPAFTRLVGVLSDLACSVTIDRLTSGEAAEDEAERMGWCAVIAAAATVHGSPIERAKRWSGFRLLDRGDPTRERSTSLESILLTVRRAGVLRWVPAEVVPRLEPQPASLYVLDEATAQALAGAIAPIPVEGHGEWSLRPRTSEAVLEQAARGRSGDATRPTYVLRARDGSSFVCVAPSEELRIVRVRRGQVVQTSALPTASSLADLPGLTLAVEEDAWLPGVVDASRLPAMDSEIPGLLLAALVADPALGERTRDLALRRLLVTLAGQNSLSTQAEAVLTRTPLFEIFAGAGRRLASIAELCAATEGPLTSITSEPPDWLGSPALFNPDADTRRLAQRLSGRSIRAQAPPPPRITTPRSAPPGADATREPFVTTGRAVRFELWPARRPDVGCVRLELVRRGSQVGVVELPMLGLPLVGYANLLEDAPPSDAAALRATLEAVIEGSLPRLGAALLMRSYDPFTNASVLTSLRELVVRGALPREQVLASTESVPTIFGFAPFREFARGFMGEPSLAELAPMDADSKAALVALLDALGVRVGPDLPRVAPTRPPPPPPPAPPPPIVLPPPPLSPPPLVQTRWRDDAPTPPTVPPSPPAKPTPWTRLTTLLARAPLPPDVRVVEVTMGPLTHFDARRGLLEVNTASPTFAVLLDRDDLVSVAAAGLRDVNRALTAVSDHDEARWLGEELRRL